MAHWVSSGRGHMTDDVGEVLIVTSVCLGARIGEIGSLEKSHGIGQTTPCSYEHYLVIIYKKKLQAIYSMLYKRQI